MARSLPKKLKNDLVFGLACLVQFLGSHLPRPVGLHLFALLGRVAFLFPHREKRHTCAHLTAVYAHERNPDRIRRMGARVFAQMGKNLYDAICLPRISEHRLRRIFTWDDMEPLQKAYDRGRGVIVITAHTGCFEMLLHLFGRMGFRSFAIGARLYDKRLDKLIARARGSGENLTYLHRPRNPRAIIRLLREGQVMGVLIDQDTAVEGVFARFLGRIAYTPSGPLKMAMRYDIPVFVVTTARTSGNHHHIFVRGPLELAATGDFTRDLVCNVQQANDCICDTITRFPDQWVWMHRRWRRRPTNPRYRHLPDIRNYT